MACDGWIRLHRSLRECPELKGDPCARSVWVELLLMAAHRPTRVRWKGAAIELKRGELLVSMREFAVGCGVSYQKLRTIMRKFASANMLKINAVSNAVGTLISLCNFDRFQADITDENPPATQQQRSSNAVATHRTRREESKTPTVETHITVPLTSGWPSAAEPQGDLLDEATSQSPEPEPAPKPHAPPTSKGALWHEMAAHIGGRDPRKLAGQWARDYGLAAVAEAHWAALAEQPADYKAWMKARLQTAAGERTTPNKGRPPPASPLQSLRNNLQMIDEANEDEEFDPRPSYVKTEAVPSYPRLVAAGN